MICQNILHRNLTYYTKVGKKGFYLCNSVVNIPKHPNFSFARIRESLSKKKLRFSGSVGQDNVQSSHATN